MDPLERPRGFIRPQRLAVVLARRTRRFPRRSTLSAPAGLTSGLLPGLALLAIQLPHYPRPGLWRSPLSRPPWALALCLPASDPGGARTPPHVRPPSWPQSLKRLSPRVAALSRETALRLRASAAETVAAARAGIPIPPPLDSRPHPRPPAPCYRAASFVEPPAPPFPNLESQRPPRSTHPPPQVETQLLFPALPATFRVGDGTPLPHRPTQGLPQCRSGLPPMSSPLPFSFSQRRPQRDALPHPTQPALTENFDCTKTQLSAQIYRTICL